MRYRREKGVWANQMAEKESLKIGDTVFIQHPHGMVSHHTPAWCLCWTGTIVRLNTQTVTVEFEVNEPGRKTVREYIDYQDVHLKGD